MKIIGFCPLKENIPTMRKLSEAKYVAKQRLIIQMCKEFPQSWGSGSTAEHLPSKYQALSSVLSTKNRKLRRPSIKAK